MKRTHLFVLTSQVVATLLFVAATRPSPAETSNPATPALLIPSQVIPVAVTNWVPRFITNVIEVRMPTNRFVDEYRTNWEDQFTTNVMVVYQTNLVTRLHTNQIVLNRVESHDVQAYQTNVVHAYQTNWKTLTLTNWENVVVMKTNWVRWPVTNVVEMDLPSGPAAAVAKEVTAGSPALPINQNKVETAADPATPILDAKDLVVELNCVPVSAAANQMEVQMVLKSVREPAAILPAREWRVERSDNAVLMFGRQPEFKGQLPPGIYKVTTTIRLGEQSSALTLRGDVEVSLPTRNQHISVAVVTPRR